MKIIYFTTAQDEKDYRSFINIWKIPLNSSNQNFHNKLIRAFAINSQVEVISIRPFSHHNTKVKNLRLDTKVDGNITWHYLKRSGTKLHRILQITPQINKILAKINLSDAIFVTDTINTSVVRSVTKINKKYKRPIIGVCTDSPSNISGTKRSYTVYLLSKCNNLNGYLALTEGLNDLFNPNRKPSYVFEGLVEDRDYGVFDEEKRPYFFFGGALMERYGVYKLIDAFKLLNNDDIDLYICGHHGDKTKIKEAIGGAKNIKFLGLLPVNKVLEYEHNALACINPRPFSEDLDRFSIPSKTLEYMSAGRPVISIKNTILMNRFKEDIIWVETCSKDELAKAMKKVLSMTEVERENLGDILKNKVIGLYSLNTIGEHINQFLKQFFEQDIVD